MDAWRGAAGGPAGSFGWKSKGWRLLSALLLAALSCLGFFSPASAQSSICAEVKIQINQRVNFERQAFDAMLRIRNGLEGVQVEHLKVDLSIKDLEGNAAGSRFFSRIDTTSGIAGSVEDGSGTVAASSTGEAHWLIIPAAGAGGTSGEGYQVGATVTYRMTGEETDRTVEVIPEVISVRPQPILALDYFLPGNVYADDALTPEIEPTVPFTLGVRVANKGYGVAPHATIESAQPQIIENSQHLAIGFQILGGYVDDAPAQPSLLIDFGDVQPGRSRMGRWLMTTTLSGQFFNFNAEYTHADALGGELTSLIDSATPHLLTHDVLVTLPQRDGVRDFLAQAIDAADTGTYRVYESDGADSEVTQEFAPEYSRTRLAFSAQSGAFVYARAEIGFDGQGRSIRAVRTDTRESVPSANIWYSKRRDASGDGWVYFLNLFESDPSCSGGTCSYELSEDGASGQASLAGDVYEDLNGDGVQNTGESGMAGVSVLLSAGDVSRAVTTGSDGEFQFADLPSGTYSLTVGEAAGYRDGAVVVGSAGGSAATGAVGNIALAAQTRASGYRFAKVPAAANDVADIAIAQLTSSVPHVAVNEAFEVSLRIVNKGPASANVEVEFVLPPPLEVLNTTTSVGTYNPTTGRWVVGPRRASETADLTLRVRGTSPASYAFGASATISSTAIVDPNPGDNSALINVSVYEDLGILFSSFIASEARVLVSFQCGRESASECDARANALDAALASLPIEHVIARRGIDFRDELRSGRWNVYWIHNGANVLPPSVRNEVGLAVLRGDGLIVDGDHDIGSSAFDPWLGVAYRGRRPQQPSEQITVTPNPYLSFPDFAAAGSHQSYQVTRGTVIATYPDNGPAVVYATYGKGSSFLFAHDLVAAATSNSLYVTIFPQIAWGRKPERFSVDAYVPMTLRMENYGPPVRGKMTLSLPGGTSVVGSVPPPAQSTAQQLVWENDLGVWEGFDATIGVRASNAQTASIVVDVVNAQRPSDRPGHYEVALPTFVTAEQSFTQVRAAIGALSVSGLEDEKRKNRTLSSLDDAAAARAEDDPGAALAALMSANDSLSEIASAETAPARIELAWALQAVQREWYVALSACTDATAAPHADRGLSFAPFAANEGFGVYENGAEATSGFVWSLGANLLSEGRFSSFLQALTSRMVYQWSLSYDGAGNGTFSLYDGITPIDSVTYTAASGRPPLRSGNGLQVSVEASERAPEADITVGVSALDGAVLTDSLHASATAPRASLHYYGEALKDGFTVDGTIEVVAPPLAPKQPGRLRFAIAAGSLSCKKQER